MCIHKYTVEHKTARNYICDQYIFFRLSQCTIRVAMIIKLLCLHGVSTTASMMKLTASYWIPNIIIHRKSDREWGAKCAFKRFNYFAIYNKFSTDLLVKNNIQVWFTICFYNYYYYSRYFTYYLLLWIYYWGRYYTDLKFIKYCNLLKYK